MKIKSNDWRLSNALLERSYAKIKSKHGEDYKLDRLNVLATLPVRHLKNKGYRLSIVLAVNLVPPSL